MNNSLRVSLSVNRSCGTPRAMDIGTRSVVSPMTVTAAAAMILGDLVSKGNTSLVLFPLALGAGAIVASIVGSLFVKVGKDKKIK